MIRTYSSDEASQWLEQMHTQLHWPVVFDSVDEEEFEADLECFSIGEIHLLHHGISPLALYRPVTPVASLPQYFSLNLVAHGKLVLSHHARQSMLKDGDIVLADSREPARLTFKERTRIVTLRLPDRLLTAHIPQPEDVCNQVLRPHHHFSGAIRNALLSLLDMSRAGVPEELRERGVQPFLAMLSFSYLANFGHDLDSRRLRARNRLSEIRRYIDDRIADDNLTPESIAAKFGLSARYLRKLFAAEGDSPRRYIQRRRLDKSAEKISNLLWKEQSITDICYDCGFKSAPHFTRAFKARFGLTPNEYRRRVDCVTVGAPPQEHRRSEREEWL